MSIRSTLSSWLTLGRGTIGGLSEETAGENPVALFQRWFEDAKRAGIHLPEAMSVATSSADGTPSARMMLLKGVDERGFVFYTNYESRKGRELLENPRAALVFHWSVIHRQVRVEGTVARLPADESAVYFRTRPRGSRLGAWASRQSAALARREELERRFRELEDTYPGDDIPLPPFWGGFRLHANRIEFWQGRVNRLHDRICYTRDDGSWRLTRLYP